MAFRPGSVILPPGQSTRELRFCMWRQRSGRLDICVAHGWPMGSQAQLALRLPTRRPPGCLPPRGVNRLLQHLQNAISEPVLPEVGNTSRAYFKHLRRPKGETMTSFCVRHREEYNRAWCLVPDGPDAKA